MGSRSDMIDNLKDWISWASLSYRLFLCGHPWEAMPHSSSLPIYKWAVGQEMETSKLNVNPTIAAISAHLGRFSTITFSCDMKRH